MKILEERTPYVGGRRRAEEMKGMATEDLTQVRGNGIKRMSGTVIPFERRRRMMRLVKMQTRSQGF